MSQAAQPSGAISGGTPIAGATHSGHSAADKAQPNSGFATAYSAALSNVLPTSVSAEAAGSHSHGQANGMGNSPLTASGRFSTTDQSHTASHNVQEIALGLRAYRQQIIASNIANADTPGYKAVDIDFDEAMKQAQASAEIAALPMNVTASGHFTGRLTQIQPNIPLKYRIPAQASADGNTVEMDSERANFAENTVMYEFSLDRAKGHLMMTLEMLKDLKD